MWKHRISWNERYIVSKEPDTLWKEPCFSLTHIHMKESCRTYVIQMSHVAHTWYKWVMLHTQCINPSRRTYAVWMSHVTHVCCKFLLLQILVISRFKFLSYYVATWLIHITRVRHEWVMLYEWVQILVISRCMNESCRTRVIWMSHVAQTRPNRVLSHMCIFELGRAPHIHDWVMSHKHMRCHICATLLMSHLCDVTRWISTSNVAQMWHEWVISHICDMNESYRTYVWGGYS